MSLFNRLPIDIFIKLVNYLHFQDVKSLCSVDRLFHYYGIDPRFSSRWKLLIDSTYSFVYNYPDKIQQRYNYLIYTQLIQLLDPITQLMIYYRQSDSDSFHNYKFTKNQRFLSLFLLNREELINYLPEEASPPEIYRPFVDLMNGVELSQNIIDNMGIKMVQFGSMLGLLVMIKHGTNIHAENGRALCLAVENGYLEIVKYLVENGVSVHIDEDKPFRCACLYSHFEIIKYLIEKGADIHARNDEAMRWASMYNARLDVIAFLAKQMNS